MCRLSNFMVMLITLRSVTADISGLFSMVNDWEEFEKGVAELFPDLMLSPMGSSTDFEDGNGKADLVRFYLYTDLSSMYDPDELIYEDYGSLLSSRFNKDYPVRFFIHGFCHHANCTFPQEIKEIYLYHGIKVNMIAVDWGALSMDCSSEDPPVIFENYKGALKNLPIVGRRVGDMVNFLYQRRATTLRKVHIVGFSLGAHIAGYAGEHVFRSWFSKVGRITGLDPAGPLFLTGTVGRHVSRQDADFVDFIHTDMGQCGTVKSVGHANFFPNGGFPPQPGCLGNIFRTTFAKAVPLALSGSCSHNAAPKYYAQSIIQRDSILYGSKCFGYMFYSTGLCFLAPRIVFGENCPVGSEGDYYLDIDKPVRSPSRRRYSC